MSNENGYDQTREQAMALKWEEQAECEKKRLGRPRKIIKVPIRLLRECLFALEISARRRDQDDIVALSRDPKHKAFNPYRKHAEELRACMDNPVDAK